MALSCVLLMYFGDVTVNLRNAAHVPWTPDPGPNGGAGLHVVVAEHRGFRLRWLGKAMRLVAGMTGSVKQMQ